MQTKSSWNHFSNKSVLILVLALTPALGTTSTFFGAFAYGVFFLLALILTTAFSSFLGGRLGDKILFPITLLFLTLLTTAADMFISSNWPLTRESLSVFLPLTAVSPLILFWGYEMSLRRSLGETFRAAFRAGAFFLLFLTVFGGLREFLGAGRLTVLPLSKPIVLPLSADYSLHILTLASGGFLLAGFLQAAFRLWESRRGRPVAFLRLVPIVQEKLSLISEPSPNLHEEAPLPTSSPAREKAPAEAPEGQVRKLPVGEPVPEPAHEVPTGQVLPAEPEDVQEAGGESPRALASQTNASGSESGQTIEWGESVDSVLDRLGADKNFEKKKVLLLGCGTGEEAYFYAMRLREAQILHPRLSFVVRGVDNFAARIEEALAGVYRESQVDFIPLDLKKKYILKNRDEEKRLVRMDNEIRACLEFEVNDYLSDAVYFPRPADFIAIHQDLSFFSDPQKKQLMQKIKSHLKKDGALYFRLPFPRDLVPEGFKRTGLKVFRKR